MGFYRIGWIHRLQSEQSEIRQKKTGLQSGFHWKTTVLARQEAMGRTQDQRSSHINAELDIRMEWVHPMRPMLTGLLLQSLTSETAVKLM